MSSDETVITQRLSRSGEKTKRLSIWFVEQDLNPVTSFPTEQEQGGLVWVHRKFIPDNAAETIDGLAHISCAAHDIDVVRHGDIA